MTTFNVSHEIEKVLERFSDELLKVFRAGVVAALNGEGSAVSLSDSAARRGRPVESRGTAGAPGRRDGLRGPKSSPAEVDALSEKILDLLRRDGGLLSASKMRERLNVDSGPFHYALGKLKRSRRVRQEGERRMAQYRAADASEGRAGGARKSARPGRKPGRKPGPKPGRKPGRKPGKAAKKVTAETPAPTTAAG